MVSRRTHGGKRAQLILVGCVTIALIIVSITLVINTNLYTENAAPALTNEQVEDARTFDLETRKGVRSLVHRVNHAERDRDATELENDVSRATGNYSALLAETYARSEPARVSVAYDASESENGERVVQSGDGEFTDGSKMSSGQAIGWFAINVDVENTSEGDSNPFEVTVENDTEELTMDIYRNGSTNLTVDSSIGGTDRETTCDPVRGRVLVDVYTGEVDADECTSGGTIHGIANLDGPYEEVEFDNGDEIEGRYEFVVNESANPADCSPAVADDVACGTPAVWTANLTTVYRGDGVDYANQRNITIYTLDR